MGVEGGALALTGCCLMAAGLWRRMRRDARGGFWRLGGRPWIAALPALLHLMVEYPLYLSAAHGVALLILWRVSEGRQVGRLPELASGILRIMGSVMAGLCALYLANGLYSAQRVMMVERGGCAIYRRSSGCRSRRPGRRGGRMIWRWLGCCVTRKRMIHKRWCSISTGLRTRSAFP
ncbi:hypothetical protein GGER_16290 [Serratia rubidaea]